jgi:hypothetical protein
MSALRESIYKVGGVATASSICGVSQRAIYKWLTAGSLPRTEYTGETDYAARLAKAAAERGDPFDAAWLLAEAGPKKAAA